MADEPTGTTDAATGTTAQAADGSAVDGSGGSGVEQTPEQRRIAELERIHEQDLARLSAGEDARRRAQELELENERLRAGYTPPTAGTSQLQQAYENLAARDPEAAQVITGLVGMTVEQIQRQERQRNYDQEMARVPTDMEDEVKRRMEKTPGLSPSWAVKDIKAERLDKEQAALDERRRKLDEEEAARKRGRVDTSVTPIPGADLRTGDMTPDEYSKLCAAAENGDRKALRRLKDYDEGRVKMRNP